MECRLTITASSSLAPAAWSSLLAISSSRSALTVGMCSPPCGSIAAKSSRFTRKACGVRGTPLKACDSVVPERHGVVLECRCINCMSSCAHLHVYRMETPQ